MFTIARTIAGPSGTDPEGRGYGRSSAGHAMWHRLVALAAMVAAALVLVGLGAPAQAAPVESGTHRTSVTAEPGSPAYGALAYPRGYVSQGNLRKDPNLNGTIILTIWDQWVEIECWLDGGDNGFGSTRWFKAHYYGKVGYLSSGVVSSQPSVGHC